MGVTYNKPAGKKYTDLAIYIDKHMEFVKETGEYPEIENTIYEYLYHIFYALSCKQNYFQRFDDYDSYALYAAAETFLAMKKKLTDAGKINRGKEVIPIKNTLDFVKAVMFPLKINYQRQTFSQIYNPENGQDTTIMESDLKRSIASDYRPELENDLAEVWEILPQIINKIIDKTPYRGNNLMRSRIYTSIVLTLANNILIDPRDIKLHSKKTEDEKITVYHNVDDRAILWHLDKSLSDYITLLVRYVKHAITDKISEVRSYSDLSDEVIDSILETAYATYDTKGEDY